MGRRKSSKWRKPASAKYKRPKLQKVFDCPFCLAVKSVECALDHSIRRAQLKCNSCGADYRLRITHLDEAVDVYTAWLDRCAEVSKEQEGDDVPPLDKDEVPERRLRAPKRKSVFDDDFGDDYDSEFELNHYRPERAAPQSTPAKRKKLLLDDLSDDE